MRRLPCAALSFALILVAPAAIAEPVEISVLTYNTHGLAAWIARDDPEARFPLLLERAAAYDVALLQEDFEFHALVDRHAQQRLTVRGNGPRERSRMTRWLSLSGAGLTTLAHWPEAVLTRAEPYGVCNGYLLGASDCFANKGWLMVRLAPVQGLEIDFWNTHLEAGASAADRDSRSVQLEALRAAIAEHSAGRAVVVGGDFNLRFDVAADRGALEAFQRALGLELGSLTPSGAWPSRLDYLFLRSGEDVRLEKIDGGKDESFVYGAGLPLSDHPAIHLRLRAEAAGS